MQLANVLFIDLSPYSLNCFSSFTSGFLFLSFSNMLEVSRRAVSLRLITLQ